MKWIFKTNLAVVTYKQNVYNMNMRQIPTTTSMFNNSLEWNGVLSGTSGYICQVAHMINNIKIIGNSVVISISTEYKNYDDVKKDLIFED